MTNKLTLKFDIKFHHRVVAFSLSMGGWLPVAFTRTPYVLVDRNVVAILRQIGYASNTGDHEANKWWFDFLDSPCYTLNPLLCAIEGNSQSVPSFDEFVHEFDSAARLLNEKLPKAKIIKYQKENYEGAYQIVEKLLTRNTREVNFLISIVPFVAERPSDVNIRSIEDKIILEAKNNHLSKSSLVLLVVLSCLYDDKKGQIPNIGKGVVKPTREYNKEQAYNVISDLRCLEALIAINAFTNDAVSFITRDKALVGFWCAINPRNAEFVGHSISFDVDLNTKLLPRLGRDEIDSLIKRIDQGLA